MFNGLDFSWTFDPLSCAFLAAISLLYLCAIWYCSRWQRYEGEVERISLWRAVSFYGGVLCVGLLLLSPINTIGRTQLFSVHMAQVVLLNTIAAPLLIAGCPARVLQPLNALPGGKVVLSFMLSPVVASIIFNLSFLLWHSPRLYTMALANSNMYSLMMLWLLCVSVVNWWPLVGSVHDWRQASYPAQMLYAFFDGLPMDIFAFVLVYCGTTLFPMYHLPTFWQDWHLTLYSDQTVAGALLLVPGVVDVIVMTPLFFHWLRELEEKTRMEDIERQLAMEEMIDEAEWEEVEQG
ncbi:MAG TPA: cytochrome c oxidase assembly protein [Dictyobacter sp.]|jgi:cytochrome c oxidase assembly factor CtaG|nr:cytochrome c oxidase assembly protein [Dictyobacter sp.]